MAVLTAASSEQKIQERLQKLDKPLYNPFVENYILHEIKTLRDENRELRIKLHETLVKKEFNVDRLTSTINNMFYIIAAASTILVFIGWSSFRETNEKIKTASDDLAKALEFNEHYADEIENEKEFDEIKKRSGLLLCLKNTPQVMKKHPTICPGLNSFMIKHTQCSDKHQLMCC